MVRGFSLVLVSVVMIVMLVFGLLSVSSAGADYRLSQKAAGTQKIYYELDSRGETVLAACDGAASDAWNFAGSFMKEKKYLSALPKGLESLASDRARLRSGSAKDSVLSDMRSKVFVYSLEKRLGTLGSKNGFSFRSVNGAVTVETTVVSSLNKNYTLNVTLSCPTRNLTAVPAFKPKKWTLAVGGTEFSDDQPINVWNGN